VKAPEKFRITLTGTTIDIIQRGNAGARVDYYVGELLSGRDMPDDIFRPWYLSVAVEEAPEIPEPISIFSLAREGAYVEVTCNHCGRTAIFPSGPISEIARGPRVQSDLRDLGRQMRCLKERGGCGERGATVRPVEWKHP